MARRKPVLGKQPMRIRPILAAATVGGAITALLMPLMMPSHAVAAEKQAERYAKCMSLARTEPERAQKKAHEWVRQDGGDAAEHCLAVALLGLGQYELSARNLEALSERTRKTRPSLSIELLGQAANAWLIAGKPQAAYAAQTRALKERPGDVEILIDRSIALASSARYWEALDDLNAALDLAPRRVDALIFRAAAYRRLDTLELAEEDVERALGLAPDNVDGLLERGNIRRLKGDVGGARSDWMAILHIAPDSPAAEFARLNMEKIAVRRAPEPPKPKPPGKTSR